MATIVTDLHCDLTQNVKPQFLHGNLFSQDNAANTINVHVFNDGEPAALGGSISANVIRSDGATVAVSGAIEGNKAYIILPQACYAVPGVINIIVKNTENTTVTTIAAVVANVYASSTDTVVDPGTIIPSVAALIAQIEAAVDSIPVDYSGLLATIAADYSSSKTYPIVGMYAWQGGVLKRNIVPITTAETYTAAHWTNAVLGDDVTALKSAFDSETGYTEITSWVSGYYATGSTATSVDVNTITSNAVFICAYVSCNPGDVFYYTGYGSSSARPWAFLNSEGGIISKGDANLYSNEKITAPANATTVIFNTSIEVKYGVIIGELLVNRVSNLETDNTTNKTDIDNLEHSVSAISEKINVLGSQQAVNTTGELLKTEVLTVNSLEITGATSAVIRGTQMFEPRYPGVSSYNSLSVTKNNDGSYTVNGTASGASWFFLNQLTRTGTDKLLSLHGNYTIRAEVISGTATACTFVLRDGVNATTLLYSTIGALAASGSVNNDNVVIGIQVPKNAVTNNFRFRIMVNRGLLELPWAAYQSPQTVTNFTGLEQIAEEYTPNLWVITTPETSTIKADFIVRNDGGSTAYSANVISANHRGYHSGVPENTLWAFAQSKLHGFDWIENDVRFTSDGVGVLLHDESINRTARNADGTAISGTVNIADITYEQACEYDFGIYAGAKFAGTKIVTVAECVAFCKNVGLKILMEPKVSGSGTYCANIVKQYAMEDNVIWISFGAPQLAEVNAVLPGATVGFVATAEPAASHVTTAIGLKTEYNKVFLDFNYTYSISSIKSSMIENDIGYGVYTLDDASALATLDPYCFIITSNTLVANKRMAENAMKQWT